MRRGKSDDQFATADAFGRQRSPSIFWLAKTARTGPERLRLTSTAELKNQSIRGSSSEYVEALRWTTQMKNTSCHRCSQRYSRSLCSCGTTLKSRLSHLDCPFVQFRSLQDCCILNCRLLLPQSKCVGCSEKPRDPAVTSRVVAIARR